MSSFSKVRESLPWFASDPRDEPMPVDGGFPPGGAPQGSSWREGAVGSTPNAEPVTQAPPHDPCRLYVKLRGKAQGHHPLRLVASHSLEPLVDQT